MDEIPLFAKVFKMLTGVLSSIVREEGMRHAMDWEMSFQLGDHSWWCNVREKVNFEPSKIWIHNYLVVFDMPLQDVCGHCGPWKVRNSSRGCLCWWGLVLFLTMHESSSLEMSLDIVGQKIMLLALNLVASAPGWPWCTMFMYSLCSDWGDDGFVGFQDNSTPLWVCLYKGRRLSQQAGAGFLW